MGIWSRLKKTFRGDRHADEIDEELQFHLAMDAASGHAERDARLRLGNPTKIGEETRAMGVIEWLDSAMQDARYGLRQLGKSPALVAAVVLSLAVGMGANTAIFSLVDAAILRPLPVRDPDSLRIIEWTSGAFPDGVSNVNGDFNRKAGGTVQASSVGANLYRRLAREQKGFESLVGVADQNGIAIAVDSAPAEQSTVQYVSANFFQALGVTPVLGRAFRDEEDRVGQVPVVVVSHRFWVQKLGSSKDALDRTLKINNVPVRLIGIAPRGFFGLRAGQWTDVYAPLAVRVAFQTAPNDGSARGEDDHDWWVRQVARLRPDVTEAAAQPQIAALFRGIAVPEDAKPAPQNIPELITLPGRRGFNALNARDSSALWTLMMLVGLLLLIVCANVANLLLSRAVGRQRESAVRLALGAARTRLFRQHVIESGVLAVLGGGAGLLVGYGLAQGVHVLFQAGRDANNAFDLHLDLRVLGYTGALSILTALLFGLAPAVRASRADLNDALKAQTRSVAGGRLRLPRILVAVQIALCLTALVAAGLLGRTLENLKLMDVGFERANLVYASVNPGQAGYTPERVGPYVDRVREEIARIPGVVRASVIQVRLLSGNGNISRISLPGRPSTIERGIVNDEDVVQRNRAGEGLFETLGVPLLAGRTFEERDLRLNAEAVVVDEHFARQFFGKENPIGRRFGFNQNEPQRYEVVGVVRDTLYNGLRNEARPTAYEPYSQKDMRGTVHIAIRSTIDSGRLSEAVRKAAASVDPSVAVVEFRTQDALIDRMLRTERMLGYLSTAFGIVALTLSAIGLGGLLAYSVARRTGEIGIRMALGAASGDVVRMVLRESLWLVGGGVVLGLPCAFAVGRLLKSALFKLEPFDMTTTVMAFSTLVGVALIAAWIPARRAAGIDPLTALREE